MNFEEDFEPRLSSSLRSSSQTISSSQGLSSETFRKLEEIQYQVLCEKKNRMVAEKSLTIEREKVSELEKQLQEIQQKYSLLQKSWFDQSITGETSNVETESDLEQSNEQEIPSQINIELEETPSTTPKESPKQHNENYEERHETKDIQTVEEICISQQNYQEMFQKYQEKEKENDELKKKIKELESSLIQVQNQNKTTKKELKRISDFNYRIMSEKAKLQVDLEIWKRKIDSSSQEQDAYEKIISKKEQEIVKFQKELQDKEYLIGKMAEKLIDFKSRINLIELPICRFLVRKINRLISNLDATLHLVKNPGTGFMTLHVVCNGAREVHPLNSIQTITPKHDSHKRFMILYEGGKSEIFESEERELIITTITDYMGVCREPDAIPMRKDHDDWF